jgi:hypothetical protein
MIRTTCFLRHFNGAKVAVSGGHPSTGASEAQTARPIWPFDDDATCAAAQHRAVSNVPVRKVVAPIVRLLKVLTLRRTMVAKHGTKVRVTLAARRAERGGRV